MENKKPSPEDFENEENLALFMGATVIENYPDHRLMDFGHGKERYFSYPDTQRYVATSCLKYATSWDRTEYADGQPTGTERRI